MGKDWIVAFNRKRAYRANRLRGLMIERGASAVERDLDHTLEFSRLDADAFLRAFEHAPKILNLTDHAGVAGLRLVIHFFLNRLQAFSV
ncbi:MAG: hypothetical protein JSS00_06055, partial [Proteobacteria bacterium]|nr:hypothetical protein [Pseudomonadota bacterium]